MHFVKTLLCGTGLFAALCASGCGHQDPVGVYAMVRATYFEPDNTSPVTATKVRVCGAFATADTQNGGYSQPLSGFMYYACTGDLSRCRSQWQMFGSLTGSCIQYGQRYSDDGKEPINNGVLRREANPTNPDPFPIFDGVQVAQSHDDDTTKLCSSLGSLYPIVDTSPCQAPAPPDPPSPPTSPSTSGGGGNTTIFKCSVGAHSGSAPGCVYAGAALIGLLLLRSRRRRARDGVF